MDQKLSTFLTLCSTMNYRRAADALHLTQPAVTKQIQALEAQYGVKLFSYDERKLRKTPQGEILVMADEHGLKLISIHDLIAYRLKQESIVEKGVEVDINPS